MEILKNAGQFEILALPEDPIRAIANAARTCYQSQDRSSEENDIGLVKKLLKRKHMPMIEFGDMTVKFSKVSRGFTHELVRHRLCSFAQESTRYVDESELSCVAPPHRNEHEQHMVKSDYTCAIRQLSVADFFDLSEAMYRTLREAGWKAEDARQVLPIGMANEIVVKANLREWIHIFQMRTAKSAHWEIRGVMCALLQEVQTRIPLIYDDFQSVWSREDDGGEQSLKYFEYGV